MSVYPLQVLIIGGGDGGVAREVIKHDVVQRVVQCEIDAVGGFNVFDDSATAFEW